MKQYGKRVKQAWPVCFAAGFTFFLIGIPELYLNNIGQFPFTFSDLMVPVLAAFLVFSVTLTGLVCLARGRGFEVLLSVLTGLLLAMYIQGNFLHGNLGELTGDAIDWMSRIGYGIGNAVVWGILIALPVLLYLLPKTRRLWKGMLWMLPLMLAGMQVAGMTATLLRTDFDAEAGIYSSEYRYLSDEGIFEVSSKDNILVFLLDRLDTDYIDRVKAEDKDFFDDLEGFTYYPDYTSMYCRTYPSVGYLLTGEIGYYDKPAGQYFDEAYGNTPFFKDLKSQNYTTKLYMSDYYCYTDIRQLEGIADNIEDRLAEIQLDRLVMLGSMCQFSAFRYSPFLLKQFFWLSPEMFKQSLHVESGTKPFDTTGFRFKEELESHPLTVQNEKNNFMYLHLEGSHAPYSMDAEGNVIESGTGNVVDQTMGYFKLIKQYMDELKKLGLYENATIFILGDHGVSQDTVDLDRHKTTALFVKPSGVGSGSLQISQKQLSQENFRATVIEAAGIETEAYGPSFYDIGENEERERRYFYKVDGNENHDGPILQEFRIHGKASQFRNWEFVRDYPVLYNH